ncbi:MAG: hypothetical protein DRJ03_14820 [Chloroflexi bacterium]|nr:MAG: hypothetical protein DRJ03_14820 [Chloroflexota bacterium]
MAEETSSGDSLWDLYAKYSDRWVEIWVPSLPEVLRLPFLKDEDEDREKKRKKSFIKHLMHAPIPKSAAKAQRIATTLDNIEDAISTGEFIGWIVWRATSRWMPWVAEKIGSKTLGAIGWFLTAVDMLNLATGVFSSFSNPMRAKNILEGVAEGVPGMKKAKLKGKHFLNDWKPNYGTFLEVAQTTENFLDVGLRLGPVMGLISEMFWAPFKVITGETESIKVSYPWERPGTPEYYGARALGAFGELLTINPGLLGGPVITEGIIAGIGYAMMSYQKSFHPQWNLVYQEIKDRKLVYNPPMNPITRKALEELGYDPDEEVGYLGLPYGEMPTVEQLGEIHKVNYGMVLRNALRIFDWWPSFMVQTMMGDLSDTFIPMLAYPEGEWEVLDTPDLIFYKMLCICSAFPPSETASDCLAYVRRRFLDYYELAGHSPSCTQLEAWIKEECGDICRHLPCV